MPLSLNNKYLLVLINMPKKKTAPKKAASKKKVVAKKVSVKKVSTKKDKNFLLIVLIGFVVIVAFLLGLI